MGILRSTYEFLKQASIAHAKWDYEVSMSIIHNRKKMWILLLLLLPIVAVSLADAGACWAARRLTHRRSIRPASSWCRSPSGWPRD